MDTRGVKRASGYRVCPCGHRNLILFPLAACGHETIWDVRCRACGGYAWFDAYHDPEFRRALEEVRQMRLARGEEERETDRRFVTTLPACGCGGGWGVVRELEKQSCIACGRSLAGVAIDEGAKIDVPAVREP